MKPIFKYFLFASTLLVLASCSSEEPGADTLPEGKYPMEFSLSFAPQSRVTTTTEIGYGCKFEEGDKVTIKVTQNGQTQTTIATLDANGNVVSCEPQLYWKSTQQAAVTVCYTNIDPNTPDNYIDQRDGLAYVISGSAMADFGSPAQVTLWHQLAQVRLEISGFRAEDYGDALFYGYTDYTITEDGEVTTTPGSGRGYITMHKDENLGCYIANVAPGNVTITDDSRLFTFSNGSEAEIEFSRELQPCTIYFFKLESNQPPSTINGHEAVLMRRASGVPGIADYVPALYVAACNLGAATPYEAGKYFWWGDTEGFDPNSQSKPSGTKIIYDTPEEYYQNGMLTSAEIDDNTHIGLGVLTPEYDAAIKQLGSPWRMMTYAEIQWLRNNTTKTYYPVDEETGHLAHIVLTSNDTGNSIIMPLTGYWLETGLASLNIRALYRTSQLVRMDFEVTVGEYKSYFYPNSMYLYYSPNTSSVTVSSFPGSASDYEPIRPVATI